MDHPSGPEGCAWVGLCQLGQGGGPWSIMLRRKLRRPLGCGKKTELWFCRGHRIRTWHQFARRSRSLPQDSDVLPGSQHPWAGVVTPFDNHRPSTLGLHCPS